VNSHSLQFNQEALDGVNTSAMLLSVHQVTTSALPLERPLLGE
jgi:hypothetical protein